MIGPLLDDGGLPGVIQSLPNGSGAGTAVWQLNNDGSVTISGTSGSWVLPATSGIAALYQVKIDVTAGSFTSSDTTGSYVDLSSGWGGGKAGGAVTFTATIREKASGLIRSVQAGLSLTGT
jgi:hypothetical protein